ncbi:RidA family protein [Thalassovita aquimarina]|uniref:RidA family protein n=1 Tax=Thalassovita aquimarina TaxID=2785917 RepID=UPI001BB0930B|nr:RidA family protein [Thalassovita aquimarina]
MAKVETYTPTGSPIPIGPYSHIAKVGENITIGGVGGVDPETGTVAGEDTFSQARQILRNFDALLRSAGSDLDHVVHIQVFLKEMADFDEMNRAYVEVMGGTGRPARCWGCASCRNPTSGC